MVDIIINETKYEPMDELNEHKNMLSEINNNLNKIIDGNETKNVKKLNKQMELLIKRVSLLDDNINTLNNKINAIEEILTKNNDFERNKKIIIDALKGLNEIKTKPRKDKPVNIKTVRAKSEKPKIENNKNKKKKTRKERDKETFNPIEVTQKLWKDFKLEKDGGIIAFSKDRTFRLPVDMNDLLYVRDCDNPHMSYAKFKKLYRLFHSNPTTFSKIIYNLRENNFNDLIEKYYNTIKSVTFSKDKDDKLLINGKSLGVKIEDAYDWVQLIANSNHKHETIYNIQKSNIKTNPYLIRCVCEHYNDSKLLKIFKSLEEKPVFLENNPSKRKDLIMNGGIL